MTNSAMRRMPAFRALCASVALLALALAGPPVARAQIGGAAEKVAWATSVQPETAAPGQTVTVHFSADIADGWKMYALDSPPPSRGVRVHFDSVSSAFQQQGDLQQSTPERGYDPNFKKEVTYFAGEAGLQARFAVARDAAAGTHAVGGTVEFMVCNAQMCLPPTRTPFTTTVDVQGGAATPEAASENTTAGDAATGETLAAPPANEEVPPSDGEATGSAAGASSTGDLDAARAEGLWGFLLLAIGAGAAALLTPCVFPMIPLTVSYFTKHTDSRAESVRMAGVYGLAIVLTFTGLGVAMALLLGAAGAQTIAANPWVNLFIGSVFVFFALSLLGLFELRLPSGLVNYVNQQGNERSGYLGVVFMGLTLTLVSFSCTAPFVGGLLAATAGGEWFHPIVGMLGFSATFALPFVGFALFPKGLESLPKSGSWMSAVKVTLGFVELAAALKFLSNADLIWGTGLLSRPLAIALTIVIFTLAGLYLLGKLRLKHEPTVESVGSLRLLAATAFLGVALYMIPGLLGAPLGALDAYLPPRQASDVSLMAVNQSGQGASAESAFDWHVDDIEAAFAEAKRQDKPVFIDFTGYTCTNCRDMEANVFPKPQVAEHLRRDFVLLRLYTDDLPGGTEYQRYQLRLTGTTALPTYAVVDPSDRLLIRKASGTMSADAFAQFLERGATQFQDQKLAVLR